MAVRVTKRGTGVATCPFATVRPPGFPLCDAPDTFFGMLWPKTVPDDLRRKLEAVLGYRNRPEPQDVWGAVLEWLESKGIAMPSDGDGKM